jgi:hypothetical protein
MRGPLTASGDSLSKALVNVRQTRRWGCKSPKPVIIEGQLNEVYNGVRPWTLSKSTLDCFVLFFEELESAKRFRKPKRSPRV